MARTAEESPVSLTVRPAAPALAPLIGALGYAEGRFAHSAELALPTGGAQLLVNLDRDALCSSDRRTRGAALQGPYTEPGVIDPAPTLDQAAAVPTPQETQKRTTDLFT
jgi:hypothetical protein